MPSFRLVWVALLLVTPAPAFAQAAARGCPDAPEPGTVLAGRAAVDAAAAPACVGWFVSPAGGDTVGILVTPPTPAAAERFALPGAGVVANEVFSAIAAIAVERARRQGLAIVHDAIANGVCTLEFTIPPRDQAETFRLVDTCTLVRTTDLIALVSQGRALRTALTSDVLSSADRLVTGRLEALPPLARAASAAVVLAKRISADPREHLTKNDVWLVTDAFLNGSWPSLSGAQQQTLTTLQIAMASARVYLEALNKATTPAEVDLAYAMRTMIDRACAQPGAPSPCPYNAPAASKLVIEWTNLAVKAASAMSGDGATEDFRTRLRSAVQLIFEAYRAVTVEPAAPLPTGLGTRVFTFPVWVETVTLAAIDGDAPQLIAAVAQVASEAVTSECTDRCAERRKVAALLTGISTFALSYEEIPPGANAETRTALLQAQRDARQAAMESVIDAATDRRGRDGQWVWSLGTGIGATLVGKQRLDLTPGTGGGSVSEWFRGNLHVPLGIAAQWLPRNGIGFHAMFSALDLGNYVAKTNEAGSSPDWQAIVAPGAQVGMALGKANNFVVVGLTLGYVPRFTSETPAGTETGSRSAVRGGIFAHYYLPLWDFN